MKKNTPKDLNPDEKIKVTKEERRQMKPLYDEVFEKILRPSIRTEQPLKNGKPTR